MADEALTWTNEDCWDVERLPGETNTNTTPEEGDDVLFSSVNSRNSIADVNRVHILTITAGYTGTLAINGQPAHILYLSGLDMEGGTVRSFGEDLNTLSVEGGTDSPSLLWTGGTLAVIKLELRRAADLDPLDLPSGEIRNNIGGPAKILEDGAIIDNVGGDIVWRSGDIYVGNYCHIVNENDLSQRDPNDPTSPIFSPIFTFSSTGTMWDTVIGNDPTQWPSFENRAAYVFYAHPYSPKVVGDVNGTSTILVDFLNEGEFSLDSGTVALGGDAAQSGPSAATYLNGGSLATANGYFVTSGILVGYGNIYGEVTVSGTGNLILDDPVQLQNQVLTIHGDYFQLSTGTMTLVINASGNHGMLSVMGSLVDNTYTPATAYLNGKLYVQNSPSYKPTSGEIDFLIADSIYGNYSVFEYENPDWTVDGTLYHFVPKSPPLGSSDWLTVSPVVGQGGGGGGG